MNVLSLGVIDSLSQLTLENNDAIMLESYLDNALVMVWLLGGCQSTTLANG